MGFVLAVRQAALRGLEVEGKQAYNTQDDPYIHTKPLQLIIEWEALKIACHVDDVMQGRNETVVACPEPSSSSKICYRDLHFRNGALARDVLRSTWPNFKGMAYLEYTKMEARRLERERLEGGTMDEKHKNRNDAPASAVGSDHPLGRKASKRS